MKYNRLGKTDMEISEVSLGTWAIGGDWGDTSEEVALESLHSAVDQGVNFFDTADVYGSGRSERLLGQLLKERNERIYVATKFGRKDDFADLDNYTYDKVRAYCENSLQNLGTSCLDLYQIHCPSTEVLEDLAVFTVLEQLKQEGLIRYYGVSVETDTQGKFVLDNSDASSLQVIVNLLRQKPVNEMIAQAKKQEVGVLARVPLANGLLSGKYTKDTIFPENDHRHFNKDGKAFNVGETFGGLPFEKAIDLVEQVRWIAENRNNLAQASIKWLLQQEGISTVIPGFKNPEQVASNIAAASVNNFSSAELEKLSEFYWKEVHDYIRGAY
ncbi:aldo/keto reductase [Streptococcus thoraltensis]|uniref:aldo/keto reductase n=1 Tax=Streptococcus thoraltensis TaxID=55085 RepID=UPI00037E1EAF|nr:aldo/keto reductase [Streptococcus thoraltensis]MDY4760649.1 aldo/keto reductase [Streptococcus thoraltensis]